MVEGRAMPTLDSRECRSSTAERESRPASISGASESISAPSTPLMAEETVADIAERETAPCWPDELADEEAGIPLVETAATAEEKQEKTAGVVDLSY